MSKKDESKYYVTNKELLPEINYYAETGIATEKFGYQIMLIAQNLAKKSNYNGYSWVNDMVNEAILTCLKYCRNWDPEKSQNPFAYLTTICNSSFKGFLNKESKHSKIKDRCYKVANSHLPMHMLRESKDEENKNNEE